MRILGLTAAALAMSLAGPAVAAMDDEKKTSGEQQNSQQQSTTQSQQGQAGSDVEQPVESPTSTSQSGTGNQGNTSNAGSTSSGSGTGSGAESAETPGSGSGSAASGDQGMASDSGQTTGQDATEQASLSAAQGKELIGKTLVGANDQQVGEINDVVVTGDSKLESVLINVGGFLGIGDKTVAIPADQIQVQGDKVVARDLTKESAENMSEYKKEASGG